MQVLRRELSREAEEESDDELEREGTEVEVDERTQIEEEAAEADRGIDELEEELSRLQMFIDESHRHFARLPCIAHKVIIFMVRHCCLFLNVNLFIFFNLFSLPFIITWFLILRFSRHFTPQDLELKPVSDTGAIIQDENLEEGNFREVIKVCMRENGMDFDEDELNNLASALFQDGVKEDQDSMDLDDFKVS